MAQTAPGDICSIALGAAVPARAVGAHGRDKDWEGHSIQPLAASPPPCFPCQTPSRHVFLALLTALATTNRASCNAEHLRGCRAPPAAHKGWGGQGTTPHLSKPAWGKQGTKSSRGQTGCAVTVALEPPLHPQLELSLVLPSYPDPNTDTIFTSLALCLPVGSGLGRL